MTARIAYNMLANGMGGLDWAGLPIVAAVLGVDDLEMFMHRLFVIKTHPRRPAAGVQEG